MQNKRKILFYSTLAVLGTLLLASSLTTLQLRGGDISLQEIPLLIDRGGGGFSSLFWGEVIFRILFTFILICLVLFPVYIFISLRSKQGRKRLIAEMIMIGVMFLLVGALYQFVTHNEEEEFFEDPVIVQEYPNEEFIDIPAGQVDLPEIPPEIPAWGRWIGAIGLAFLITLAAAYFFGRKRTEPTPAATLDRLADEAQHALNALRSGGEVKDVIIRCYLAMSSVLEEEKRIVRRSAMTAREFERLLSEKGLPAAPVRHLTYLFEEVRYGNRTPVRREEDLAMLSLAEIVQHCRGRAA